MSKAAFGMLLEGPGLHGGAAEVRQLGPALVELGELCERAHAVLHRDETSVSVRLRPAAPPSDNGSSLALSFVLRQRLEGRTPNLFDDSVDAQRLLELLGLAPGSKAARQSAGKITGLLELLAWLGGRLPQRIEELVGGWSRLTIGEDSIEAPAHTLALLRDAAVRGRVDGLLLPLLGKGIERVSFEQEGRFAARIERDQRKSFTQPTRRSEQGEGETLVDSTYLRALGVVKVPFRPNLKWVLGSDGERLSADMQDQRFLDRHQDGLTSYATGDILTVRLRTTAVRTASGLRTEHAIVEVVGHLSRSREARQRHLDEAEGDLQTDDLQAEDA